MNTEDVAVVTGGASGIGASCARKLKKAGFNVVVADWNKDLGQAVADELSAIFFHLDVSDEVSVFKAAEYIFQEVGPVKALINSAGVLQSGPSRPRDISINEWDRITSVDQRGTYLSCVAFGEKMRSRCAGVIINIASVTGVRSVPLHSYAPAKAAVISMTETLAAEWGVSGVRVNCVSPGYTLTPSLDAAIRRGDRNVDDLINATALGRLVDVEEVSDAVSFLISDRASAITGINLPVDAGWLCASSWCTYGGLRKDSD